MIKFILLLSALLMSMFISAQVSNKAVREHIEFLSSKELNGRIAGKPGGQKAADYLIRQWEKEDVGAFNKSMQYTQSFNFKRYYPYPTYFISGTITTQVAHLTKSRFYNNEHQLSLGGYNNKGIIEYSGSSLYVIKNKSLNDCVQQMLKHHNRYGAEAYLLVLPHNKKKSVSISFNDFINAKNQRSVELISMYRNYLSESDKILFEQYLSTFEHLNVYVCGEKDVAMYQKAAKNGNAHVLVKEKKDSVDVRQCNNIISKIKGRNSSLPAIVFCAHYDHIDSLYSRPVGNPQTNYFPGADDNASGTTAVLEMAKILSKKGFQPERDIYFCLFDAEEYGLYGSAFLADSLKNGVGFVVNMDMVGRNKKDKVKYSKVMFSVAKGKEARKFNRGFDAFTRKNSKVLRIRRHELSLASIFRGYPSDQASFYNYASTSVFHTGDHQDYHTHNDTADKINYIKLTEYINLMAEYIMEYDSLR